MLCYFNCSILTKPTGFLKLLQVILSAVCLALVRHYWLNFGGSLNTFSTYLDRQLLGYITIGGMIVVTLPTLVGKIFGGIEHSSIVELLHSVIGSALYAISAGFVLSTYANGSATGSNDEAVEAGIALGVRVVLKLNYLIFPIIQPP